MGRFFIGLGLLLLALGAVLNWAPWLVSWFGRLPGDIDYESGGTRVFIPLTSMIVVSVVLTVLLNLFMRR